MKIFGINISLGKPQKSVNNTSGGKQKRATNAIRKQYKRQVSFQIEDIKSALLSATNPDMPDRKRLLEIFRYIMLDGHLKSQAKQAILKVLGEPFMLYKNGVADIEVSKKLRKKWFKLIIKYIVEAELWDFSVAECDEIDAANFHIGKVTLIDREYVSIDKHWILTEGTISGEYLDYSEIKDEIDLLEFGGDNDFGCLLECAYNILWKYYSRSDWSRANEKVGTPILSVVADTNNEDELDDMETKAASFGSDGYIIGQKGDTITLLERKSDNFHLTFKDKIALCNDEVSKIINGQTGTSDMKAFVGAAEVHERVMEDFHAARLEAVVDEVRENVLPYLIKKGFALEGYEYDYPALIRTREAKINGPQPPVQPTEPPPPAPDPKNKPRPNQQRK